jgi:hypothetical protein
MLILLYLKFIRMAENYLFYGPYDQMSIRKIFTAMLYVSVDRIIYLNNGTSLKPE